ANPVRLQQVDQLDALAGNEIRKGNTLRLRRTERAELGHALDAALVGTAQHDPARVRMALLDHAAHDQVERFRRPLELRSQGESAAGDGLRVSPFDKTADLARMRMGEVEHLDQEA